MHRSFYVLVGILALTFQAFGQIPRTISYQGVLCDATGKPKPDNSYQMTFRLYESETGPTAIWTETKNLATTRGLFSTELGDQVPFSTAVKFDRRYWLGVQVGAEAELSPRTSLSSVGNSFKAVRSDTAAYAEVALKATKSDTALYATVAGNGGSNPWQTSGSNIYYNSGNVGVGTTNPGYRLDVRGSSTDNGSVATFGNSDLSHRLTFFGGRLNDPNPFIQWKDGDPLRFVTDMGGWSEKMRIAANGNVGIGTTNPPTKLDVVGRGTLSTSTPQIMIEDSANSSTAKQLWLGYDVGNDFSYVSSVHQNTSFTPLALQPNGGNVGIGTTSPTAKLHVNGDLVVTGEIRTTSPSLVISVGKSKITLQADGIIKIEGEQLHLNGAILEIIGTGPTTIKGMPVAIN